MYTRSSLSSIAEQFAVWLKHSKDYLKNENHSYKHHLVQGIQLQTWTTKKSKVSPSNSCWLLQLESTQVGGYFLVVVVLLFAILLLRKRTAWNRKNGVKVYMLCHKGADLLCVVTAVARKTLWQPLLMSTRSIYMLAGSSYLLHERGYLIFENSCSYFDCSIEGVAIM